MLKFLILIGIVILVILIAIEIVKRKFKRFMNSFIPKQEYTQEEKNQVLYSKDDVVVLKGEAKKNENE